MSKLVKFCIVFLVVAATVFVLERYSVVEFGNQDYWDHRGILFLGFITFFPRLTLLFSSVATGGIIWWFGWLFVPRILVATLATVTYWNENPILVAISWVIAIGGESSEKFVIVRKSGFRGRPLGRSRQGDIIDVTPIHTEKT